MIIPGNKRFHYERQTASYYSLLMPALGVLALFLLVILPFVLALPLLGMLTIIASLWARRAASLPLYYQCTLSDTEFYQWHPYRRSLRVRMPIQELRRLYSMRDKSRRICKLQCVTARGQTILIPVKPPFPLEEFLTALRQANPAAEIDAHF